MVARTVERDSIRCIFESDPDHVIGTRDEWLALICSSSQNALSLLHRLTVVDYMAVVRFVRTFESNGALEKPSAARDRVLAVACALCIMVDWLVHAESEVFPALYSCVERLDDLAITVEAAVFVDTYGTSNQRPPNSLRLSILRAAFHELVAERVLRSTRVNNTPTSAELVDEHDEWRARQKDQFLWFDLIAADEARRMSTRSELARVLGLLTLGGDAC